MRVFRFGVANVLLCLVAALFCSNASAQKNKKLASVFVDAQTTDAYREQKDGDEGPKIEFYHVMEGRRFPGTRSDKSLDKMDFQSVVENLRVELQARNFYPARDFKEGELLLVVHWGVTDEPYDPEDPQNDIGEEEEEDVLAEDEVIPALARESAFDYENRYSAGVSAEDKAMLGFDRALDAKGMSLAEEQRILSQVNTERYFMVVSAFDWQKKIKTKESELLWTTRFSMESVGTNFNDSLPALTRAAQAYFGVHLDKMANEKTHFGIGEAEFGELEVIEMVEGEKKEEGTRKKEK